MFPFSTEMPVQNFSKAEFVALVLGWLKGTNYCRLFETASTTDFERENASVKAHSGEELKLQEFTGKDGKHSIGFRYDYPDIAGRLWRTELVISGQSEGHEYALLRARTQCIAQNPNANIEKPRKPFIIKSLIQDGKAGEDGYFKVSDKVHHLDDNSASVQIAAEIATGSASLSLPIVYISCESQSYHALTEDQLRKLAYDLGGVAHVIVEPSRDFSIKVRNVVDGINVYGGTIGVYAPGSPRGRKFYIGGAIKDSKELFSWVYEYCYDLRSRLPSNGWDWTELQEQAFRRQRERDRNRLSTKETEELYLHEIDALKERICELDERSQADASNFVRNTASTTHWDQNVFSMKIDEIYVGETSDRIQHLIKIALQNAEIYGLDERSMAVANSLLRQNSRSKEVGDLKDRLARVITDPKKFAKSVASILEQYGYVRKSEKNHIRLEPRSEFDGLESITIVKTPSDHRSLKNQKSQIENALGIAKFD